MLTFQFNPDSGAQCPICGQSTVASATLIPIHSKKKPHGNSRTLEAVQVHTNCLAKELFYTELDNGTIIMAICDYPYKK